MGRKNLTAKDIIKSNASKRTFNVNAVPKKQVRCPICRKPMFKGKISKTDVKLSKFFGLEQGKVYYWCQGLRVDRGNKVIPVAEFGLPLSTINQLLASTKGARINYREIVNFKYNVRTLTDIDVEDQMYDANKKVLQDLTSLADRFDVDMVLKNLVKGVEGDFVDEIEDDEETTIEGADE